MIKFTYFVYLFKMVAEGYEL